MSPPCDDGVMATNSSGIPPCKGQDFIVDIDQILEWLSYSMREYYALLEVAFSIIGAIFLVCYVVSIVRSYKYVKKNLGSICSIFFGNPLYYKKLNWSNHFLIEMAVGMIAALKLRELTILKRETIFSKGYLNLASNINDFNLQKLLDTHGGWYKSVVRNLIFLNICLFILMIIWVILKLKL